MSTRLLAEQEANDEPRETGRQDDLVERKVTHDRAEFGDAQRRE